MAHTLEERLTEVTDEESFLRFVHALAEDEEAGGAESSRSAPSPYSRGPRGWENGTIAAFLEAGAAWAEDMGDRSRSENPWRRCAEILLAGKSYE